MLQPRHMIGKQLWIVGILTGLALCGHPSSAEAAPRDASISRLLACRAVTDAAQRLACYDREAVALGDNVRTGKVTVVDDADVRAIQRSRFGFAAPGLDAVAAKGGEKLSSVATTVQEAHLDGAGKLIVSLDDHSGWRQIDDYPVARMPHQGDAVVISRAALGSFMLRIGRQAEIRVRRIR